MHWADWPSRLQEKVQEDLTFHLLFNYQAELKLSSAFIFARL